MIAGPKEVSTGNMGMHIARAERCGSVCGKQIIADPRNRIEEDTPEDVDRKVNHWGFGRGISSLTAHVAFVIGCNQT